MTFVMTYDERNRKNLDNLAKNTKIAAYKWYQYCIEQEIDILIYETIRTEEQQKKNVENGASQTMKSYHLVGQALDFVKANSDKTINWNGYDRTEMKLAIAKAKTLGFEWGGDWANFIDRPHLQYNYKGYGTDVFEEDLPETTQTKPVEVTESTGDKNGSDNKKESSQNKQVEVKVEEKTIVKSGDVIIKSIQETLNKRYNTKLVVDGFYGEKTKKALVIGLQTELNKQYNAKLVVDGEFGTKTLAACRIVKKGANGNITYIIQAILVCSGYSLGSLDSIFGEKTEKAVKSFQKAKSLVQDGIVGNNTWRTLFK